MTSAERDNLPRWREGDPAGHVESWFVKANAPAAGRAFWLRLTVLSPAGRPRDAVAEVWAMAFDRGRRHVALKETFPVAGAEVRRDRFRVAAGRASIEPGATRGRVDGGPGAEGRSIEWDLAFEGEAPPLHLLPWDALYESRVFPKSKALSPCPDARFSGRVVVEGEAWEVAGWPGMQGHNWGSSHAFRYAWAQANAFRDAPGTYFEGASARVRVAGALATPWLTLLFLRHEGRDYDFRGARHWLNRSVRVEAGGAAISWSFAAEDAEHRLSGRVEAPRGDAVDLAYRDPDGSVARCLNSKLATCRLDLEARAPGGWERRAALEAPGAAALELLVRPA